MELKQCESSRTPTTEHPTVRVVKDDQNITINTGDTEFLINRSEFKPFEKIYHQRNLILDNNQSRLILKDQNDGQLKATIKNIEIEQSQNNLNAVLYISGEFVTIQGEVFAAFTSELTFFAGQANTQWRFTLHNPKAAKHKGGLWDLGDPGSVFFKHLSLKLGAEQGSAEDKQCFWKYAEHGEWQEDEVKSLLIYQDSSGGENWKSQNHVNKDGVVPTRFRGYECIKDGVRVQQGDRASPFVHLAGPRFQCTVYVMQFWQNFPKAIIVDEHFVEISLFPEQFSDLFELQGGEKKTHTVFLSFDDNKSSLDAYEHPSIAEIPLDYYAQTQVLTGLPCAYRATELDALVHAGISGNDNFFTKREVVDEYGWRHFGDLFADHESLYCNHEEYFLSHYNNQYDAVYGFARQFMLTGNKQWFELMSDLAQHVMDIDIYNTEEDRHEYNSGLFWHTDHYVDVSTCTHRSFSQSHISEENPKTGGGPGHEHCYATGLATYFAMSGCRQSKQAVLALAGWMIQLHEGNGGVLDRALKFLQKDFPTLKRLVKGEKVAKFSYPFTRGTGNYISVLLDAYSVTLDEQYITQVEQIIRSTIHPNDDISVRHLENIEVGWSYIILLQAIIKYLQVKISLEQLDPSYCYARDSLMHYTDWMLENEYPYLEKPEVLEFPNHTWVAQDLRKAYVFSIAARLNPRKASLYLQKSKDFFSYVTENLKDEKTRSYARILVILMQNHMDYSTPDLHPYPDKYLFDCKKYVPEPCPNFSITGILYTTGVDLFKRLLKLSVKREWKWLKLILTR